MIRTTELEIVNYELLRARDNNEIQKLLHAACDRGIFFLDTNGPSAAEICRDITKILDAQRNFFALPLQDKLAFQSPLPERGYHKEETPNVETLLLSREEELVHGLQLPQELQPVAQSISRVSDFTDAALRDMYRILCSSVKPCIPTTAIEKPHEPNYTNLTLGYSADVPGAFLIPEHADSGLITLLYYDRPSLEILEPNTGEWQLVQPQDGLQVVYIGKHFSAASSAKLKAAPHRVVNPEHKWALVVYLLHPGLDHVDDPGYSR